MKQHHLFFSLLLLLVVLFSSCETEDTNDTDNQNNAPADTAAFELVGSYEMNYGPHDLAVTGQYVFACRDDKIYVISLSDVSNPTLLTTIDDLENSNTFESLLIDGNTLYAGCAATSTIYLINIADPASPFISSKFSDDIFPGNPIKPLELFLDGTTLWVAGSNGQNTMVVAFDASTGSSISVDDYWAATSGNNAAEGVWANSTHVFLSTVNGIVYSLDKSNLSSGSIDDYTFEAEAGHEHWGRTLIGKDNLLYWADWGAGFVTIDISSPSSLSASDLLTNSSYLLQHPSAEGTNVYDIVLDNSRGKIYLANGWSGLLQLDMDDPATVEKFIDQKDHQYYCIANYGNYLILGDIAAGTTDIKGLKIYKK